MCKLIFGFHYNISEMVLQFFSYHAPFCPLNCIIKVVTKGLGNFGAKVKEEILSKNNYAFEREFLNELSLLPEPISLVS